MDSRLIAAIAVKNRLDIKTLTFGCVAKERRIASKVASVLGLPNECLGTKSDLYKSFIDIDTMKQLVRNSWGTINLLPTPSRTWLQLNSHRSTFISGGSGTEIWADPVIGKFGSVRQFVQLFLKIKYRFPTIQEEYVKLAARNLEDFCQDLDLRTLFFEAYMKPRLRSESSLFDPNRDIKYPIVDSQVLTETFSLPIAQRRDKLINRLILKNEFPRLYKVPDVRPLSSWNGLILKVTTWIRRRLGLPREDAVDRDIIARKTPSLKPYIQLSIPPISRWRLLENTIHSFYVRKLNISSSLFRFLTYSLFHVAS